MAVEYESSSTTNFAATTSVVITKPTGLKVGDIMVGLCGGSGNTTTDYTFPAGWVVLEGIGSGGESIRAAYTISDAADVAATDFTFTGPAGEYNAGSIMRISGGTAAGIISSSEYEAAGGTFADSDLTPSVVEGSLLLFNTLEIGGAGAVSGHACVSNNPTWAEAYDFGSTAPATDMGIASAYGTYDALTTTGDFSVTGLAAGCGIFIAIYPKYPVLQATEFTAWAGYATSETMTVNYPATIVEDDLMIMVVAATEVDSSSNISLIPSGGWTGNGWTVIRDETGGTEIQAVYAKKVVAGDVTAGDLDLAANAGSGGDVWSCANVYRIDGQGDILDIVFGTETNSGSTSVDYATLDITPTNNNCLWLFFTDRLANLVSQTVSSWAIDTDNVVWTERFDEYGDSTPYTGGDKDGILAGATAVRSAITSNGGATLAYSAETSISRGMMLSIPPQADVTILPDPLVITSAPNGGNQLVVTVTAEAVVAAGVNTITSSVPTVTVTVQTVDWTLETKPTTTWTYEDKT